MTRPAVWAGGVLLLGLGAGCASVEPRASFDRAVSGAGDRLSATPQWVRDDAGREAVRTEIRTLLAEPLTADRAVAVAFLANPELQATFERLGLAQAEVAQASRLANPSLEISRLSPEGSAGGHLTTIGFELPLLDALLVPLRKRMAELEQAHVELEVGSALVELAAEARVAVYQLQGAEALAARLAEVERVEKAGYDFARSLFSAGNLAQLEVTLAEATWAEARVALAEARREVRHAREQVHRLLGLWGEDTAWTVAPGPPPLPATEIALDGLERRAIEGRLDLAAGRSALDALGRALALRKKLRFTPIDLDLGIETERELDGLRLTGPTLALRLPLFDAGKAEIAHLEAETKALGWQLEALAVAIRSEVREKRDDLVAARDLARFTAGTLVPLRRQALDGMLRRYNMMLGGTPDVLAEKAREIDAERRAIEALRDYWIARAELERAVGGRLVPNTKEMSP